MSVLPEGLTVAPPIGPDPVPLHETVVQAIYRAGLALADARGPGSTPDAAIDRALRELDDAVQHLRRFDAQHALAVEASESGWREADAQAESLATEARSRVSLPQADGLWAELVACESDERRILEVASRHVVARLGGEVVATKLRADATLLPMAVEAADPSVVHEIRRLFAAAEYHLGEGLVGEVAATGITLFVPVVPPDVTRALVSAPSRPYLDRHQMQSLIIVPLLADNRVLGTLGVSRVDAAEPFTQDDRIVLERVAELAALAMTGGAAPRPVSHADAYRAVFDHGPDGVLFTAPDGSILAANPAACEMLGRSEDEICRVGRHALMVADDPGWKHALVDRALHGVARAHLPMRRADGEVFLADVSSAIFESAGGERRACVFFRDVTETAALQQQLAASAADLRRLALEDELTGLANRRGFLHAVARVFAHADRDDAMLQLVYLDVNQFKAINDRFGHPVGDRVLAQVADALRQSTRGLDIAARIGGDEFVVLLYRTPRLMAERVMERVQQHVDLVAEPEVSIALDWGLAERSAGSGLTIEQLLRDADAAMYRKKERSAASS